MTTQNTNRSFIEGLIRRFAPQQPQSSFQRDPNTGRLSRFGGLTGQVTNRRGDFTLIQDPGDVPSAVPSRVSPGGLISARNIGFQTSPQRTQQNVRPQSFFPQQVRQGGAVGVRQGRGVGGAGFRSTAGQQGINRIGGFGRQQELGGGNAFAGNIQSLIESFQTAQDEARKENEARFAEIKTGLKGRRQRVLDLIRGTGEQERKDIQTRATGRRSAAQQDLISRGIGTTTIRTDVSEGVAREEEAQLARLSDRLRLQEADVDTRLSGDLFSFLERREDQFPDFSQLINLAIGLGQGGRR